MTKEYNIVLVIGTRPEAIKMAPVYEAIETTPGLKPLLLATGQHREQLLQALSLFDVKVAKNLDLMTARACPPLPGRYFMRLPIALRN
jgi:UDP-N-acetylglucosamine 2-epimerase (non-hydrolysing)